MISNVARFLVLGATMAFGSTLLAAAAPDDSSPGPMAAPATPTAPRAAQLADPKAEAARTAALSSIVAAQQHVDPLASSLSGFFALPENDLKAPLGRAQAALESCVTSDGGADEAKVDSVHTALGDAERILDRAKAVAAEKSIDADTPSNANEALARMGQAIVDARGSLNSVSVLMTSHERARLKAAAEAAEKAEKDEAKSDATKVETTPGADKQVETKVETKVEKKKKEKKSKSPSDADKKRKEREAKQQEERNRKVRVIAACSIMGVVYQHWEQDKFLGGWHGRDDVSRRRVRSLYDALVGLRDNPTNEQVGVVQSAFETLDQHLLGVIKDGATRPAEDARMKNLQQGFLGLRRTFERALPKSDRD